MNRNAEMFFREAKGTTDYSLPFSEPTPTLIHYRKNTGAYPIVWPLPGLKEFLEDRFGLDRNWSDPQIFSIPVPKVSFVAGTDTPVYRDLTDTQEVLISLAKRGSDPESSIGLAAAKSAGNISQISKNNPHPETERFARTYGLIPIDLHSVLFEGTLLFTKDGIAFKIRPGTISDISPNERLAFAERQLREADAFMPNFTQILKAATYVPPSNRPYIAPRQTACTL